MPTYDELRIRKLELQVRDLETPPVRTPAFWISVASAVVAVVGVAAQSYLSKIEASQAKLDKTEAEQLRDKAKQETAQLIEQRDSLQREKTTLLGTNTGLKAENEVLELQRQNRDVQVDRLIAATSSSQSPELQQARAAAANSSIAIAIYSLNMPKTQFDLVTSSLKSNGYTIIKAEMLSTRTPWLATEPTVLYYADETKARAQSIAAVIDKLLGLKTRVARGAGDGIPRGQEKTSVRVHLPSK